MNRWPSLRTFAVVCLASALTACQAPSTDDPESVVMATYRDGAVTLEDLDQYLVQTSNRWTWDMDLSGGEQLEELVRRVATERLLADRAEADDTAPAERIEARLRDIKRRAAAQDALLREPPEPVERDDLGAYLESQRERIDRPERRRVLHLFKRFDDRARRQEERAALEKELEALRDRTLAGENFSLLARDHSDSETRHREGILGEVVRGQFSEDFDSVVFGLDEGFPSDPVFTADGGHLFFVADIFPERRFTVDDLGPMLLQELLLERQYQQLRAIAQRLMEDAGEEILPESYFEGLLSAPSPPAVLFRVADVEFRLEDFRRIAESRPRSQDPGAAAQLLQLTYDQEVILHYGYERLDGGERLRIPAEELDRERLAVVVELHLDRVLRQRLSQDDERPRAHHARNTGRFSRPVTVSLTRLEIPAEAVDSRLMGTLEGSVEALDAGQLTLEDLAERHGGRLTELPERSVAQLRAVDPKAVQFAFALQPGQHTPPYTWQRGLVLSRLDTRREAEPRTFEEARADVVEDYLRLNRQDLYRELSDELLAEADFAIDRDQLAQGGRLLARLPH